MTDMLEEALAKVKGWPEDRQNDAARLLLAMHDQNVAQYALTAEQIALVERSKAQADSSDFVPDEAVGLFFNNAAF
mgnify:CR=1 FL=1